MGTAEVAEVLKSGVYRIDLGGGWFYVGSSNNLTKRNAEHHSALRRGDHYNQIMQRAYNKYGLFNFTILGRYSVDLIIEKEQTLLDRYCQDSKCANIAIVADSPSRGRSFSSEHRSALSAAGVGRKPSDKTRAKMRESAKRRKRLPLSADHRAAIGAANSIRKISDTTRAKISKAKSGKKLPPHSIETKTKISAALMGRVHSAEHRSALSTSLSGRKLSAEHRAAISVAGKAYHARAREAALKAL